MSVEIQTMGEGGIFEIAAVVIDEVLEIQPFTDVEYEILSSARDILAEGSILEAATVATNSANTAAGLASEAASAANDAAGLANSATTSANTAAGLASEAASAANGAASAANDAAGLANSATTSANTAAGLASEAASAANGAAGLANSATTSANTAAGAANTAASSANSAASAANTAAATAASFVGTGPAGYYATLTALQAAYPMGDTGIYVELEYGHWYYWSGSAWIDGGLFQAPLAVVQTAGTSETDVMSQKAVTDELAALEQEQIQGGVYDISSHNDDAVFESLQALLSSANLGTFIPISVRRGGMSIQFIQGSVPNSDNKYVQYRLMSDTFNTTVANWQGVDDEPTAGSNNLVKSGGVASQLITKITCSETIGTRFWKIPYEIVNGKIYRILQESGDSGEFVYRNTTGPALLMNKWVTVTAVESGSFCSLKVPSGSTLTDAPVVYITEDVGGINKIIDEIGDLPDLNTTVKNSLVGAINSRKITPLLSSPQSDSQIVEGFQIDGTKYVFPIKKVVGTEGTNPRVWLLDYPVTNGKTYHIYQSKGDIGNFCYMSTVGSLLKTGEWITVTANNTGNSYILLPQGETQDVAPIIFIVEDDSAFYPFAKNQKEQEVKKVYITCKRNGTSGVDADFCGLNAIGDAVTSITDASEFKQYYIMVDGHFLFTNPKFEDNGGDFKYVISGEPTPVFTKKYVHIIGIDKEKAVVEVNLDAELNPSDFPTKPDSEEHYTFMDYQPVYVTNSADIQNITFIGKNVRYTSHIEQVEDDAMGATVKYTNCSFVSKLATKGSKSCMTIGEIRYFNLIMQNCDFINENENTLFGGHTPLSNILNGRENCSISFNECKFITRGTIGLDTYAYNRQDVLTFKNCTFNEGVCVTCGAYAASKRDIGTIIRYRLSNSSLPYDMSAKTACGLRFSTTTGASSSVRINPTCSAFGIVGNALEETSELLPYSAIKQYGYEFKDDNYGSHAYACGWVNVDPTTGNSLGSLLGDCSSTSKILTLTINGTDYSVVFNTNLTNETNENIIAIINAVISSVAVCDTFNPETQQYPNFGSEEYYIENTDSDVIERGMGIVKTSITTMRRAKQTDGYIDGIAIDTIYPHQKGRIIRKGQMYNLSAAYTVFSITPVLSGISYGSKISIDENNDGKFKWSATKPVLRALSDKIVEII